MQQVQSYNMMLCISCSIYSLEKNRKPTKNVFMLPVGWHIADELSVGPSVRLKTLTFEITFAILKIATWYFACMCITFWEVKGQGQRSNFAILKTVTWYLAFMHIWWSWTFWVVKGEVQGHPSRSNAKYMASVRPKTLTLVITFLILKIATWYLACMCISWSCTFWVVKGQDHSSRSKVKYMGGHSVSQTHLVFLQLLVYIY
jgi:hypothetical protein